MCCPSVCARPVKPTQVSQNIEYGRDQIRMQLTQQCTILDYPVTVKSMVVLDVDPHSGKITKQEERWMGHELLPPSVFSRRLNGVWIASLVGMNRKSS
jgi:hypothetical protein